MVIREYLVEDGREMAELFYETVHTVNAKDYTERQLAVWATGDVDLEKWNASFLAHYSLVAVEEGKIVGFGDMDEQGYLDRLYVHKDNQGKGVASAICRRLEERVQGKFTTHASITALPFFLKRGYRILREQQVERQGVRLTNFVMEKAEKKGST
ncbi:MAG: GNAT family N-acetyltransferase [Oscillospiraceae bacterium]